FRKYRLNFNELLKSEDMDRVVEHFGFKMADDLITSVGYGKITPLQIIRKIVPKPETEEDHESIFNKIISRVRKKKPRAGVIVQGVDDILIKFGKCCQPVPGDAITGYITIGHGVTVHRTSCINALKVNPERQIDVEWNKDVTETYPVKICVSSSDRVGLLADVAANISKSGANILSAKTETRENGIVDSFFTLAVKDIEHLDRVLTAIKKVKLVQDVKRLNN
ncbi:MAG: ACT domain-containing protein, partial [Proteobacteria bacterium]|nr:ACT domain-containing protein [Pseudomonadota bacterium]